MHMSLRQVLISLNAAGDGFIKVITPLKSKLVSVVRQLRRIGIEGTEDEVLVSNIIMFQYVVHQLLHHAIDGQFHMGIKWT